MYEVKNQAEVVYAEGDIYMSKNQYNQCQKAKLIIKAQSGQ